MLTGREIGVARDDLHGPRCAAFLAAPAVLTDIRDAAIASVAESASADAAEAERELRTLRAAATDIHTPPPPKEPGA